MNIKGDINKKKYIFSVEGNIGVGKSTFLKKFSKEFKNFELVFEPNYHWQSINGYNLLNEFYKDMKRWAYSFETYALMTRINSLNIIKKSRKNLFLFERSFLTNFYTFGKACHFFGQMNKIEWEMYKNWYEWIILKENNQPDFFIYLRASPETCDKRIKIRKREEETKISFEYLSLLHNYHDNWLLKDKNNIYVLHIDAENDFESDINNWNKILFNINNFLEKKLQ